VSPVFIAASIAGAGGVLVWRIRETSRPITMPKIIIPPLGMSTGFAMFFYPPARVPLLWAAIALAAGALLFYYPLARSSHLTLTAAGTVFLQRSKAFLWILLGLVVVRFALRGYVEQYVSPIQTGALFFLLAFGMIARWRVGMLIAYRRLVAASGK
jgi:membrane protein CcdC involved in cytochrome C biogenesis